MVRKLGVQNNPYTQHDLQRRPDCRLHDVVLGQQHVECCHVQHRIVPVSNECVLLYGRFRAVVRSPGTRIIVNYGVSLIIGERRAGLIHSAELNLVGERRQSRCVINLPAEPNHRAVLGAIQDFWSFSVLL